MYVVIISICIVAVAFMVQQFANQIDEQLNACGTGTFKDGECVCQHPYTGTHCEIVDCGYGKLVDSVFAYDTITTPNGPAGCECENQYWGFNCLNCTSKYSGSCTGPCKDRYFGARCDILCKSGTENDAQGVLHRQSGGTYNYFVESHGFCLNYGDVVGTVKCREGRAGAHCQYECPNCVYGKCNLDDGTCDCFDGYFGDLCEGTCPGRCSGLNGVCQEDGTCNCYDGFTGADCSLECCVEGRGTDLGSVHGECANGIGGCLCFEENIPHNLPDEMAPDLDYYGIGWQGSECDCHENITCGGRGTCGDGECVCAPNFQGARCDICADDKIGPFCQYDRWQCPNKENAKGEFVARNNRGDYACKCNSGFTGPTCEQCIASAYPKSGDDMCTIIIPDSLCNNGRVNPDYDGTGDMCICDGNFDEATDCASCVLLWYGPDCDHYCHTTCTESGGVCSNSAPGCLCPKGFTFEGTKSTGGSCVTCGGEQGCANGTCIEGRCRCDPNYYGDNCEVTPPLAKDKICNGYPSIVVEENVPCNAAVECTDESEDAPEINRQYAYKARLYDRVDQTFCHRDDTPKGLKNTKGCCVDKEGDGFCDADKLEDVNDCTFINGGGLPDDGEIVNDICNKRVLENEVNVFEWCLSKERACTMNGECEDPDLCQNRCDAGITPSGWINIWEYEHTRTMADVMSEPWKFASNFSDPYEYRDTYAAYVTSEWRQYDSSFSNDDILEIRLKNDIYGCPAQTFVQDGSKWKSSSKCLRQKDANSFYCSPVNCESYFSSINKDDSRLEYKYRIHITIDDVCVVGDMYDVCRDYLIPDDANVFNLTHKFTGKWESMPNYQDCTLTKSISTTVDGKKVIAINPPVYAGVIETLQENTAAFARYQNGDDAYTGTVNHMIDSITLFAKGQVDVLIYDYVSETCSDFVRKVGSHHDMCSQIKFYELDYDWGAFCNQHANKRPITRMSKTDPKPVVCDPNKPGIKPGYYGCDGARLSSTAPSVHYCRGTSNMNKPDHPAYRPDLNHFRDYYEACCDWTGSECVEKSSAPYPTRMSKTDPKPVVCDPSKRGINSNYYGCDGARYSSGAFAGYYCTGTQNMMKPDHPDYRPDLDHFRDYYEACCDWTGSECVEKSTEVPAFDDRCYRQSTVCTAGCDNYQEGCEGLPLLSEFPAPMPAPCDQHWDNFCTNYMDYNHKEEGVCAYTQCACEGYGVGGPACDLQCPVPAGISSEQSCGAGEDPPWGQCLRDRGVIAFGFEQGRCECFNGGDPALGCTAVCEGEQDCSPDIDTPFSFEYDNCTNLADIDDSKAIVELGPNSFTCHVWLRDSICNFFRGRCECATPFTVFDINERVMYQNPHDSYRIALMQGYEIDEYLPFTTYNGTLPDRAREAFDANDPNFKCFKDILHTLEVPCDWIRALKHFARGGSYRIGDCHNLAPGTDIEYQVPCSGHGFPQGGTCACDYAEEFELRSSGVGLAFEQPGLTQTPWRGKACQYVCPGYDMKSMDTVCSGHGRCESDARCACDQGWTGYKCDLRCEAEQKPLTCSGHGVCDERNIIIRSDISDQLMASNCEHLPECTDINYDPSTGPCTNETIRLAMNRVVKDGNKIYHMYDDGGIKVTVNIEPVDVNIFGETTTIDESPTINFQGGDGSVYTVEVDQDTLENPDIEVCQDFNIEKSFSGHPLKMEKGGTSFLGPWSGTGTLSFTNMASGEYEYYCTTHPNMKGTITVKQCEEEKYLSVKYGDNSGLNPTVQVCPDFTVRKSYNADVDLGGDMILHMKDSFGDGWNGYRISLAGNSYTFSWGASSTRTISGSGSADTYTVTRLGAGSYIAEVSWSITCKDDPTITLASMAPGEGTTSWSFQNTCPIAKSDVIEILRHPSDVTELEEVSRLCLNNNMEVYTYYGSSSNPGIHEAARRQACLNSCTDGSNLNANPGVHDFNFWNRYSVYDVTAIIVNPTTGVCKCYVGSLDTDTCSGGSSHSGFEHLKISKSIGVLTGIEEIKITGGSGRYRYTNMFDISLSGFIEVQPCTGSSRPVTLSDFFVEGTAVRHNYGYSSDIPFMPCVDRLDIAREKADHPLLPDATSVVLPCNVRAKKDIREDDLGKQDIRFNSYEVFCGVCDCEEKSSTGNWTGYDCRTPALGFYRKDARSQCPGMTGDMKPCNGGGTCKWGSTDGLGTEISVDATKCYCGETSQEATVETAPRYQGGILVHAESFGTPIYFDVIDEFSRVFNPCPSTHPDLGGPYDGNQYWCYVDVTDHGLGSCSMYNSEVPPPEGGAWGSNQPDCIIDISKKYEILEYSNIQKVDKHCDWGTEKLIRVRPYAGSADNPGTDLESRKKACYDACANVDGANILDSSPASQNIDFWDNYQAYTMLISKSSGRCYCIGRPKENCSPGSLVDEWSTYDAYDIARDVFDSYVCPDGTEPIKYAKDCKLKFKTSEPYTIIPGFKWCQRSDHVGEMYTMISQDNTLSIQEMVFNCYKSCLNEDRQNLQFDLLGEANFWSKYTSSEVKQFAVYTSGDILGGCACSIHDPFECPDDAELNSYANAVTYSINHYQHPYDLSTQSIINTPGITAESEGICAEEFPDEVFNDVLRPEPVATLTQENGHCQKHYTFAGNEITPDLQTVYPRTLLPGETDYDPDKVQECANRCSRTITARSRAMTIHMSDGFGDGWNGVEFTLEGHGTLTCCTNGFSEQEALTLNNDPDHEYFIWRSKNDIQYESETNWEIRCDANDAVIARKRDTEFHNWNGDPYTVGVKFKNTCPEVISNEFTPDGFALLNYVGTGSVNTCICGSDCSTTVSAPFFTAYSIRSVPAPYEVDPKQSICHPKPLSLTNYKSDCSCKFGFTGSTCETPRMMCLWSGEETDGTECICRYPDGTPNNKVSKYGCCTIGTYWDQDKYASFTPLNEFEAIPETPFYANAMLYVCQAPDTLLEFPDDQSRITSIHNYVANTDEYYLKRPSVCVDKVDRDLFTPVFKTFIQPSPDEYTVELPVAGGEGESDATETIHIAKDFTTFSRQLGVDPAIQCAEFCVTKQKGYKGFTLFKPKPVYTKQSSGKHCYQDDHVTTYSGWYYNIDSEFIGMDPNPGRGAPNQDAVMLDACKASCQEAPRYSHSKFGRSGSVRPQNFWDVYTKDDITHIAMIESATGLNNYLGKCICFVGNLDTCKTADSDIYSVWTLEQQNTECTCEPFEAFMDNRETFVDPMLYEDSHWYQTKYAKSAKRYDIQFPIDLDAKSQNLDCFENIDETIIQVNEVVGTDFSITPLKIAYVSTESESKGAETLYNCYIQCKGFDIFKFDNTPSCICYNEGDTLLSSGNTYAMSNIDTNVLMTIQHKPTINPAPCNVESYLALGQNIAAEDCNCPVRALEEAYVSEGYQPTVVKGTCTGYTAIQGGLPPRIQLPYVSSKGDSDKTQSRCDGDCDKDSDCLGHLQCFQRGSGGPGVPHEQCIGSLTGEHDYCYDPTPDAPVALKNRGNPTIAGRCEGDCDRDWECGNGLVCYQRTSADAVAKGYYSIAANKNCNNHEAPSHGPKQPTLSYGTYGKLITDTSDPFYMDGTIEQQCAFRCRNDGAGTFHISPFSWGKGCACAAGNCRSQGYWNGAHLYGIEHAENGDPVPGCSGDLSAQPVGHDYCIPREWSKPNTMTIEACGEACDRRDGCNSFSFDNDNGVCWTGTDCDGYEFKFYGYCSAPSSVPDIEISRFSSNNPVPGMQSGDGYGLAIPSIDLCRDYCIGARGFLYHEDYKFCYCENDGITWLGSDGCESTNNIQNIDNAYYTRYQNNFIPISSDTQDITIFKKKEMPSTKGRYCPTGEVLIDTYSITNPKADDYACAFEAKRLGFEMSRSEVSTTEFLCYGYDRYYADPINKVIPDICLTDTCSNCVELSYPEGNCDLCGTTTVLETVEHVEDCDKCGTTTKTVTDSSCTRCGRVWINEMRPMDPPMYECKVCSWTETICASCSENIETEKCIACTIFTDRDLAEPNCERCGTKRIEVGTVTGENCDECGFDMVSGVETVTDCDVCGTLTETIWGFSCDSSKGTGCGTDNSPWAQSYCRWCSWQESSCKTCERTLEERKVCRSCTYTQYEEECEICAESRSTRHDFLNTCCEWTGTECKDQYTERMKGRLAVCPVALEYTARPQYILEKGLQRKVDFVLAPENYQNKLIVDFIDDQFKINVDSVDDCVTACNPFSFRHFQYVSKTKTCICIKQQRALLEVTGDKNRMGFQFYDYTLGLINNAHEMCYCEGFALVDGIPQACPSGRYSSKLTPCSATCELCPVGKFSTPGSSECGGCLPGEIQSSATECTPCEAGKYAESGDIECTVCPVATFASTSGASFCTQCDTGRFQHPPLTGQKNSDTCRICPGGWSQDQYQSTSCKSCGGGKYTDGEGATSCKNCAAGKYQNLNNQQSSTACKNCATGKYQNSAGQSSCKNCPTGQYQDQGGQIKCKSCAAGQYQNQNSQTGCKKCPSGQYQGSGGRTSCSNCPKGYFATNAGYTRCYECQAGKYASSTGRSSCTSCGKRYSGFYWVTSPTPRVSFEYACDQYKPCTWKGYWQRDCGTKSNAQGKASSGYGDYWRKCCNYQQNYFCSGCGWFCSRCASGDARCYSDSKGGFGLSEFDDASSGRGGIRHCEPPTHGKSE